MNDLEAWERIRQHIPYSYLGLDYKTRFHFEGEYQGYKNKTLKPMSQEDFYILWVEKLKGLECQNCRIG